MSSSLTDSKQSEQNLLGADEVVPHASSFFLCLHHSFDRRRRETFKHAPVRLAETGDPIIPVISRPQTTGGRERPPSQASRADHVAERGRHVRTLQLPRYTRWL